MNVNNASADGGNCSAHCQPCQPCLPFLSTNANTAAYSRHGNPDAFGMDGSGFAFLPRNGGMDSLGGSSTASSSNESAGIDGQLHGSAGGDDKLTQGEFLLAKDLEKLSLKERERVYDDIHGVAKEPTMPHDPAFVATALEELEDKLTRIREKNAYNLALFLYPRHVKDPNLRLMYLHAFDFNIDTSARKLVNMFQKKLEIFGRTKLGQVITLEDLSPGGQELFKSGTFQFYSKDVRDRSGRPILFLCGSAMDPMYRLKDVEEVFFYILMKGAHEMTMKEIAVGFVGITHHVDVKKSPRDLVGTLTRTIAIAKTVPLRVAACHMCSDNTALIGAASLFQVSINASARVRVRTCVGSFTEVMYYLATFGIDGSVFPLDSLGRMRSERLEELMALRRKRERDASAAIPHDLIPTDLDVLIGRGRPFQNHAGNIRFLQLIDSFREEHAASTKAMKSKLAQRVKLLILESGARFLKQSKDGLGWEVVKDEEARRKVRHGFRAKHP